MANIFGKIQNEMRQFTGVNKLFFVISAAVNAPIILKDKTILTMRFIKPLKIKTAYKDTPFIYVKNYYEIPFYTYDYSDIVKEIDDDSLVLDIGAHFGEVSYRFLKEKKGYCYMFEPNPNNAKIIKEMFRKNHMHDYKIFNYGLGEKDKDTKMYLNNPLSYEGSVVETKGKETAIKIKTLNARDIPQLKSYNKVFMKIDVEGYEVEVIKGMHGFLKECHKQKKDVKMLIEIKSKANEQDIKGMLSKIFSNVRVKIVSDEDYLFRLR